MSNEQDKLDNIFKKRLEDPARHFSFNDDDWEAMEQMLDANKKPRVLWLPIISSIAAMILLVFGWWFFKPATVSNQPVKQQVAVKAVPDTAVAQRQVASVSRPDTTTEHTQIAVNPAAIVNKTRDLNADFTETGFAQKTPQTNFAHINAGSNVNSVNAPTMDGLNKTTNQQNNVVSQQPVSIANNNATKALQDTSGEKAIAIQKDNTPQIAANNTADKPGIVSAIETVKAPQKKITRSLASRPQFALGVIASTDLNGVNSFGSQTKVGSNFGVQVSMSVKKFTFTTGAVYSIKPYMTGFANYSTSYTFKQNPLNVTADCRMIDVPINVGYQVYKKQRNKISVGTGLSSYFMLYENYKYDYGAGAAAGVGPASFEVKNSKNYLLSVANLNVNFERQLNPKLSLSVQPYMKIPLSAVGYSQVSLQSAGVAVGFNYNFNSFSKPK